MLTLAFARDENYNTNCNATTRVRINGDDEEATKTVSGESGEKTQSNDENDDDGVRRDG